MIISSTSIDWESEKEKKITSRAHLSLSLSLSLSVLYIIIFHLSPLVGEDGNGSGPLFSTIGGEILYFRTGNKSTCCPLLTYGRSHTPLIPPSIWLLLSPLAAHLISANNPLGPNCWERQLLLCWGRVEDRVYLPPSLGLSISSNSVYT